MLSDEPKVKEATGPSAHSVLWNEALWSEDEATRLYNLASAAEDLLSDSQRKTWAKVTACIAPSGRSLNLKTFREYFNRMKEAK
jgi:hypothetical protein